MRPLFVLFCFSFLPTCFYSQKTEKGKKLEVAVLGFWNVENLYDTINDHFKNDDDFTPAGINGWNGERYLKKIDRLAETISQIGLDASPDGLAFMGLCEVENKEVLQDLVNTSWLKSRKYAIIHLEGQDHRGVDPSFIYNPLYFKPTKSLAYNIVLPTDSTRKTRHILVVSGLFQGEAMVILVNHWPSRRGGEKASQPNRNAAAKMVRHISDSVLKINATTKLVVMGDLNDDPVDESVKKTLGTFADGQTPNKNLLYNPMEKLFNMGIGTLAWRDKWNLFDQILFSKSWLGDDGWKYYGARVYNKPFLKNGYGKYRGYPLRTYTGTVYTAGYSDHFPVYVVIGRVKDDRSN